MFGGKVGGRGIRDYRKAQGSFQDVYCFTLALTLFSNFSFCSGFEWNGFLVIVLPRCCCNRNRLSGTLRAPLARKKAPFGWRLGEGPERRDNARSAICRSVEVNVRSELIRV
ncbi:hypothetical protein CEXT_322531 [Caerostris extrusa]|uniref:Uncharacterized protein n=1 Tax=Caerostris extrusa TaxID=172846 RepID=A0AAV4W464_CAEEX|nr:hypothetical protein CEXT_322531 [Caerostris extrusa]